MLSFMILLTHDADLMAGQVSAGNRARGWTAYVLKSGLAVILYFV